MNVFCPNCGSENQPSSKFCWKCGTSLAGLPTGEPAAEAAPDAAAPEAAPAPPPPVSPPPGAPIDAAPPPPAAPIDAAPPPPVASPAPAPPAEAPAPQAAAVPAAPPPLVPAAPPPAVPAAPPPPVPPAPVGYQPAPGGRPPSRISTPVLVGGLVAVLGIGAAVGIVLGSGKGDPTPGPGTLLSPAPSIDTRTPGPVVTLEPIPTQGGGVVTPGPDPTRVPDPTPGTGDTMIVRTPTVSIIVPASWETDVQGNSMALYPPEGGAILLASEELPGPATASQILANDLGWFKENFPDAKVCDPEKDVTLPQGPPGRQMVVCYTAETQSGEQFAALDLVLGATNTEGGKPILYYLDITFPAEIVDEVKAAIVPTLKTITWSLYTGG